MAFVKQEFLRFDNRLRQVSVGDRSIVLPEKNWQVLSMLVENAPAVVGRAAIINSVWRGNFFVGEKGLNQAMWSIRAALADNTDGPRYIRTVPRVGYQWIYSENSISNKVVPLARRSLMVRRAGLTVAAIVFGIIAFNNRNSIIFDRASLAVSNDRVATGAYLVNKDIHVRFASGCVGIMRASIDREIGSPLLSEDGREVAVAIQEAGDCRLVTIDVTSGELRDFGSCPVI